MLTKDHGYLRPRDDRDGTTPDASDQLEAHGCAVIPNVLSAAEVASLSHEINEVYASHPADGRAGDNRSAEIDEEFRYEMVNRSGLCQQTIGHKRILETIEPLLGEDCHVIANTCWRNPPVPAQEFSHGKNHGGGFWHIDSGPHIPRAASIPWPADIPYPIFAIGAHIYLQDCPIEAGPTGVIKGSHKSGSRPPADQFDDVELQWQGERVTPLLANAGDVALFVSDAWHRRLPSLPGDPGRFFLQVHYARRDIAQRIRTTEQINHLSAAAKARIKNTREAQLLGLHKPFFYDG